MASKIIQLVTKADTEDYLIIRDALKLYDEYLHSVPDLTKAVKVRAILGELNKQRNRRLI